MATRSADDGEFRAGVAAQRTTWRLTTWPLRNSASRNDARSLPRMLAPSWKWTVAVSPARAFGADRRPVHYERRWPEETVLYQTVARHLNSFIADVEADGERVVTLLRQARAEGLPWLWDLGAGHPVRRDLQGDQSGRRGIRRYVEGICPQAASPDHRGRSARHRGAALGRRPAAIQPHRDGAPDLAVSHAVSGGGA